MGNVESGGGFVMRGSPPIAPFVPFTYVGSVSSPIKRMLIEMLKHGALRRQKEQWKSCVGNSFRDITVITAVSRNLAVISVDKRIPGAQFARLNQIGIYVARAVLEEAQHRETASPIKETQGAQT